jgi:hypothetical protein
MSDAADTSAEAVERLAGALDRALLYDGGGEYSTLPEDAAATLRALLAEREAMREALLTVAPRHQGGHSEAGEVIAIALGLPFPLRMPAIDAARAALSSTKGTQP